MQTARKTKTENQRERLNRLYRFQRHFYDATRCFLLFGRDDLLRKMRFEPGESILEIGCGTGRNLLELSPLQPRAGIFGLDASDEMLKTAGAKLVAHDKQKEIILRRGLAEEFSFRETFGLEKRFDKIFISYSLSMFPAWEKSLSNALDNIKPDGDLFIVDFWDGRGQPVWINRLLRWWLGLFKVYYRPEFLAFLTRLEKTGAGRLTVSPVGRNYAFIAHFQKCPGGSAVEVKG